MSVSTINLASAYQTPRRCADGAGGLGPAQRIERPPEFPPGAEHTRYLRRYMVDKRFYGHHPGATTAPPPWGSVQDPVDPNAWLLHEVTDAEFDNLLFFTRTFGTIPKSWAEVSSANVALPAFADPETLAAAKTITASSANQNSTRQTLTSAAHGYSANDLVRLNLRLEADLAGTNNDVQYHFSATYPILSVTTDTFDVNLGPLQGGVFLSVLSPATAQKLTGYPLRPIRNNFVPTRIQHDYFLPGVSAGIFSPEDIPLAVPFTVQRGTEADDWADNTLSDLTIPTQAQYWQSILDRTRLILDCSLVPVLGVGPLLDRRTISYAAQ